MATKVKICGLSRIDDIIAVNAVLPDFIGFVFAPSRRQIDEAIAIMLKTRLDPRIKAVGVFVDQLPEEIASIYISGVIDLVQLHGEEDEEYITRLKSLCGCPVIKAISVGEFLPPYPENADFLLFDTLAQQRGGSGLAFDWELLSGFDGLPFFLAGGLTAANALMAVDACSPFCVDTSSGVETGGYKDAAKIRDFVLMVRK